MRGRDVREARKKRGWTQSELAKRVNRSQAFISIIERGGGGASEALKDIARVLGLDERPEPVAVQTTQPPAWTPAPPDVPLPVGVRTWQRPSVSGDCLVVAPAGPSAAIVAALDVAGSARSSVPATIYLRGWLRGWLMATERGLRIDELARQLEVGMRQAGIEAAYFLGVLELEGREQARARFQSATGGFPEPLLLVGVRSRSVTLPPLSTDPTSELALSMPSVLEPPWRLILASDGLLRRLGGGSEVDGRRRLLQWNEGPTRDQPLQERLSTPEAPSDDESCFVLDWTGWTSVRTFDAADAGERHRVCREVSGLIGAALGERARSAADQLLVESLQNVWRHAYALGPGPVTVRVRHFGRVAQLEIEDEGRGGEIVDGGGIRIMRHWSAALDFRRRYPHGTVVLAELHGPPAAK